MNLVKPAFIWLMIIFISAGCGTRQSHETASGQPVVKAKLQRFGMVTGLKPEKMNYYKQLHAAVWPAVQKKIKECNIQNYSIYLKNVNGALLLFSYFEYSGNDFEADMKRMAADSATQKWWKETDPCQQPLPDAAAGNRIWSLMEEVFHEE